MVGAHALASTEVMPLKFTILVEVVFTAVLSNGLSKLEGSVHKKFLSWRNLLEGWLLANACLIAVATLHARSAQR